MTAPLNDRRPRYGPSFWVALVVGSVLIAVGGRGLLSDGLLNSHSDLWRWFVGAGVVHDFVLAPAFVGVGLLTRQLPPSSRVPVRVSLAATFVLTMFAWPLVRGWGRRSTNPSALPLDYGRNLVATLVVLWVITGLFVAVRIARARR